MAIPEQIANEPFPLNRLYETDFAEWVDRTVQLLRKRQFAEVDLDHLIEEIEALSKRDKREIQSRLIILLFHLLKYAYQPDKCTTSWESTIVEQRRQISLILNDSPSLRNYFSEVFIPIYQKSRIDAARETKLPITRFPEQCPFTLEDTLNEDWLPE
jgi:Domain of unknown function DUF29